MKVFILIFYSLIYIPSFSYVLYIMKNMLKNIKFMTKYEKYLYNFLVIILIIFCIIVYFISVLKIIKGDGL